MNGWLRWGLEQQVVPQAATGEQPGRRAADSPGLPAEQGPGFSADGGRWDRVKAGGAGVYIMGGGR